MRVRLPLQFILVGLVGGGALGRRHSAGGEGGAAGTHVVEVSRELRLPGLLPQRLPNGRGLAGTAGQSGVGTDMERIPGPSWNQDTRRHQAEYNNAVQHRALSST